MYPAHTGIGRVRTQSSQPGPESIFIHYTTPSPHVAEQGINVILKGVIGRSHQFKSNVLYQIICYVIHSIYNKKKSHRQPHFFGYSLSPLTCGYWCRDTSWPHDVLLSACSACPGSQDAEIMDLPRIPYGKFTALINVA